MKIATVIVAAGSGTRAGSGLPKQYREIGGKAVLRRSIEAFCGFGPVVCVISDEHRSLYDDHLRPRPEILEPVCGGTSRQESVRAGLRALKDEKPQIVLVHDAARPFVTGEIIRAVIGAVAPGRGALPGLPVADTLARVENAIHDGVVERDGLMAMQTPQGFRYDELLALHEAAEADHTDDAGLARAAGLKVAIVPGSRSNVKLTNAEDFAMAEAALAAPDIRVGHGYDTHRWTSNGESAQGVWLCGLLVPHDRSLEGHSDADVGLHALTDALLGTIGAGDIGSHFPPSDERWRGAASDRFLDHAAGLVREAGGTITHADITLVCETPKIGPHRDAMRKRVAEIIDIDVARVSVKATTNEERGFVGRGEGMVALATATTVFA